MTEQIKQFEEKALAGDRVAQYNMGQAYMMGAMGEPNPAEAARWWRMAAEGENGLPAAQYNLALTYLNLDTGMTSGENLLSATTWLRKAAKQGHEQAKIALDELESEMER